MPIHPLDEMWSRSPTPAYLDSNSTPEHLVRRRICHLLHHHLFGHRSNPWVAAVGSTSVAADKVLHTVRLEVVDIPAGTRTVVEVRIDLEEEGCRTVATADLLGRRPYALV